MEQQQKHGLARRTVVGVGKAWSYSLGITSLARELGRIGGNLAAGSAWVRRKLADSPENYRNETFQDAVARLGLSDEHLISQARAFNLRAHSWMAALLLATAWLAAVAWSDAPLLHALLCFAAIALTFSKAITWRFRACQIRDAELYSFGPWFFSPGRW